MKPFRLVAVLLLGVLMSSAAFGQNKYDLNEDSSVDVGDVTSLVFSVLYDSSASELDLNEDGSVDVGDVTTLVGIVLNGNSGEPIGDAQTITVGSVQFTMIPVAGGTFQMGSPYTDEDAWEDEMPQHQVTLSDFYMGETEVTQELWLEVMGSNPSAFTGENLPVENVSWEACQEFITKLNERTGKTFRFPTEAEWEYAARGGSKSHGYKYAGSDNADDVAWYNTNSGRQSHPVKTKAANELGLYDMSGNVWEWCSDRPDVYSGTSQTNPTGASEGSARVCRGGGWYGEVLLCRVATRSWDEPSGFSSSLGLRLVLAE